MDISHRSVRRTTAVLGIHLGLLPLASLATVYLDGAALPTSILYGAPTDMWDVAQVEILRGPVSDEPGVRLAAEYRDFDGFIRNVTRGAPRTFGVTLEARF